MIIFKIIAATVDLAIYIMYFALFIRVIISWVQPLQGSVVDSIATAVTEPILVPIRAILSKSETLSSLPVDFSTFFAMLLIIIIQAVLPSV